MGLAFLTALALHAGALAAMAWWQAHEDMSPPGVQEITIDLAPAMQEVESIAPAAVAAYEEPPAEANVQPPEQPVPEVQSVEEAPQETANAIPVETAPVAEAIAPDAAIVLPPNETVIAKPAEEKPKPEKREPPKKEERKPDPKPRRVMAERKATPSNASPGQAAQSREATQGAAASADPTVLNRYAASLAASLRSRLRYPEQARSRGTSGIATVRFTMERSGRIINAALVRSAGDTLLDEAALAAARPGSSLPAAPETLPQQQFTFSVPLQFIPAEKRSAR